jgi:hypothetical protein
VPLLLAELVKLINLAKPRAIPSPNKKVRMKLIVLGTGGNVRGGFCFALFMNLDSKTQFFTVEKLVLLAGINGLR